MSEGVAPAQVAEARGGAEGRLLRSGRLWLWVLVVGGLVWLLTAFVAGLTDVEHLVANVVLLGSFLVPVTLVLFALSRTGEGHLTAEAVILGFLAGGTLGTVFAAVTEVYFLPTAAGTFVGVGLFEEAAKTLVVVAAGTMVRERRGRDGMILGATVGAGFAAFETAGYALQTFIKHLDDHAVLDIVSTEAQRGALAPFGHITWTALVGGAVFAAWRDDGFGPIAPVAWTFAGVVALHAAWDATYGWAILVAKGVAGDGWHAEWPNTESWIGSPSGGELTTFNVAYDVLVGLNALIGTVWLVRRWRAYRAQTLTTRAPRTAAGRR
jgi:RsiW-degrading membrane proteinase PrsW (M82 family)